MFIDLYLTGGGKGAFSLYADPSTRYSIVSNYFRGGSDEKIEAALKKVSSEFKKKTK